MLAGTARRCEDCEFRAHKIEGGKCKTKGKLSIIQLSIFHWWKVLVTALPCVSAMSLPLMCFCTGERFFVCWMFKKCCCIAARSLFLCAYYWIDAFFSHIFLIHANELLMTQSQSTSPSEGTLTWLSNHHDARHDSIWAKVHFPIQSFIIWMLPPASEFENCRQFHMHVFVLFCFVLFFVRFFVRFFL